MQLLDHRHERRESRSCPHHQHTAETFSSLVKRETTRDPVYVNQLVILREIQPEQCSAQTALAPLFCLFQDDIELQMAIFSSLSGGGSNRIGMRDRAEFRIAGFVQVGYVMNAPIRIADCLG